MSSRTYEFLSAQDASFLTFEGRDTHMHVAAVAIFEAGALADERGRLDIERIRRHVAARIAFLPRYRQRLDRTPLQGRPIWVDDARFDARHHVRHTALPNPGTESELRELVGHVLEQQLDRRRPLWELWFVEGLDGNRCAMIAKIHHCLTDGVGGIGVLMALLSPSPEAAAEEPDPWVPRAVPSRYELAVEDAIRNVAGPFVALRAVANAAVHPRVTAAGAADAAAAVWNAVRAGMRVVPSTPLNAPIGPHRAVDWRTLDLAAVKDLKKRLEGTVNDVVLAVVAGAVHRLFARRRFDARHLDYRVVVPVNMRHGPDDDLAANRVSAFFVSLPVAEKSPLARFRKVRAETERLKSSDVARGTHLLIRFADWMGSRVIVDSGTRFTARLHPYHLIVTNVAGPEFPLYMLGSRLLALYPLLPLFEYQGLAVAVMSSSGRIGFGLVADPDLVPDLRAFGRAVEESFAELQAAASASAAPAAPDARSRAQRVRSG